MKNSNTYSYPELTNLINNLMKESEKYNSLSDDLLALKPNPKSWCLGEIFEHLVLFNRIYLDMIRQAMDENSKLINQPKPFQPRLIFQPVISMMRPPYKLKMKTITPMVPDNNNGCDYHQQFHQFLDTNRGLLQLIDECERNQIDLNRVKTRHKLFYIKMSLIEFILLFEAHQARHLWQADQTLLKVSGSSDSKR